MCSTQYLYLLWDKLCSNGLVLLFFAGYHIWLRLVGRLMHRVKKVKLEDETEGSRKRYGDIITFWGDMLVIIRSNIQGYVFYSTDWPGSIDLKVAQYHLLLTTQVDSYSIEWKETYS